MINNIIFIHKIQETKAKLNLFKLKIELYLKTQAVHNLKLKLKMQITVT
jgi:hypothetical protein